MFLPIQSPRSFILSMPCNCYLMCVYYSFAFQKVYYICTYPPTTQCFVLFVSISVKVVFNSCLLGSSFSTQYYIFKISSMLLHVVVVHTSSTFTAEFCIVWSYQNWIIHSLYNSILFSPGLFSLLLWSLLWKFLYTYHVLQVSKFLLCMCLGVEKYACLIFHEDGNFYF